MAHLSCVVENEAAFVDAVISSTERYGLDQPDAHVEEVLRLVIGGDQVQFVLPRKVLRKVIERFTAIGASWVATNPAPK